MLLILHNVNLKINSTFVLYYCKNKMDKIYTNYTKKNNFVQNANQCKSQTLF